MAKTVKLADIAEKLGVSVLTVSKAIHGKDGVGDELRAKILKVANELGYSVKKYTNNGAASYVIGILTASRYLERGSSFYWSLYERLLKHLSSHGDFGFLEVISAKDEEKCAIPKIVQENRAAGLIVMGMLNENYIQMLADLSIPFTMLDTYHIRQPYDTVISDGYFGMYTITDYVLQMGHRKILFVGTIGENSSITDHYFGYCRAMMQAGLTVTPDMIIPDRDSEGKIAITIPEDLTARATALVCNCDYTAYTVLQKLTAMQIKIPEDISIVGFDNYTLSEIASKKITTYNVNQNDMAAASAQQIRNRIQFPQSKHEIRTVSGELLLRESVRKIN